MGKNQNEGYDRMSGYRTSRQGSSQRRSSQVSRAYTDDRYAARRTAGNSMQNGRNTVRRNTEQGYRGGTAGTQNAGSRALRTDPQMRTGRSAAGYTNRRKRSRRKRRTALTALVVVLLLLIVCAVGAWFLYQKEKKPELQNVTVNLETLDSPYVILINKDSGTVISSKSGDSQIYPASLTKIMTVLVAIEQIRDLNQTITMSYDYYDNLYAQDASRAGFEPGEEAVIKDLLYGAMLPSGAECCMELAIQAAGSEAAMADLMNQKVTELGLTQTHFTNCTGLHSAEQYTTPHEMAKILQAALKNKTFREVFMTHSYTVKPTNIHPDGFTFWSTMFKNMQAENVIGGEILGGKTGYTGEAGHCLASFAEVEGKEYILVTAGWAANPRTEKYHINDAFLGYNALGRALAEAKES